MKALVLAAGFGTRLKPFTETKPKPLCPFFGIPFIDLALYRLRTEISSFAINTHHLADKISKHCHEHPLREQIQLFYEEKIRGTGGALFPLKAWLGDDDLLIYNADIISNIDIKSVMDHHRQTRAMATMVMLPRKDLSKTPVYCSKEQVLSFGKEDNNCDQALNFSGVHIVSNEFVQRIPCTIPWSIIDTYQECIAEGNNVSYLLHNGYWEDLGTPKSLWQGHCNIIQSSDSRGLLESLGINSVRAELGLAPIEIHQESLSAWPADQRPKVLPQSSFVQGIDTNQDCQINSCIVIDSETSHVDRLSHCVGISNTWRDFN